MTCPRKLIRAVCGPGDLASDHPLATAAVKDVSGKTVSGGGAEQRSVMRAWAWAHWALGEDTLQIVASESRDHSAPASSDQA